MLKLSNVAVGGRGPGQEYCWKRKPFTSHECQEDNLTELLTSLLYHLIMSADQQFVVCYNVD